MLHVCQLLNLNLIHNFVSNIKGHISISVDKHLVCRAYGSRVTADVAGWMVGFSARLVNMYYNLKKKRFMLVNGII